MGLVLERSADTPTENPNDLFYTIQVDEQDGVIEFEGVAPSAFRRWASAGGVDLVPFEVGMYVLVGIERSGAEETLVFMEGEPPNMGDCP